RATGAQGAAGSGPREALPVRRPPDPRRLVPLVRLGGIGRLLVCARAVSRRQFGDRIDHLPVFGSPTDHEDHAPPVAAAHEDVLSPGRAVEEVPCTQASLLPFHEYSALARQDEEILLLRLPVVEAVRLTRLEHVQPDAELRE